VHFSTPADFGLFSYVMLIFGYTCKLLLHTLKKETKIDQLFDVKKEMSIKQSAACCLPIHRRMKGNNHRLVVINVYKRFFIFL